MTTFLGVLHLCRWIIRLGILPPHRSDFHPRDVIRGKVRKSRLPEVFHRRKSWLPDVIQGKVRKSWLPDIFHRRIVMTTFFGVLHLCRWIIRLGILPPHRSVFHPWSAKPHQKMTTGPQLNLRGVRSSRRLANSFLGRRRMISNKTRGTKRVTSSSPRRTYCPRLCYNS